jgi:membrane protease YdiL (CAAX protease family)
MENKIPVRFFVFTFCWSWIFWGIAILLGQGNSQNITFPSTEIIFVLMIIGVFGPAIGAIISIYTIEGKSSIKIFFKQFLSLNFGWKTWTSIFLIIGCAHFVVWIIPEVFGEDRIQTHLPSIYIFPIYILIMIFFGGGQEEIGWQGYILPHLENKFGLIIGGLFLGIIWGIWHLPLWIIPGSTQVFTNFYGFILLTIGYSYLFSWIIYKSGKRLFSGLVVHGVANAFAALFPFLILEDNVKQIRMWTYFLLIFVIGIIIVVIRTYRSRITST